MHLQFPIQLALKSLILESCFHNHATNKSAIDRILKLQSAPVLPTRLAGRRSARPRPPLPPAERYVYTSKLWAGGTQNSGIGVSSKKVNRCASMCVRIPTRMRYARGRGVRAFGKARVAHPIVETFLEGQSRKRNLL